MSFTAQVKDELSRVEPPTREAELAQLSALVRVCGTLSFHGSGRYSIRIATETGAVARTIIKLTHKLFDLETALTVRRSVLHKTRNYLIEIPEQERLADDLEGLGILVPGRGIASGVPRQLLRTADGRRAFVRGAFMAGGFIADPRGDFHLEIAVTGETFAHGLVDVMGTLGVSARLNHRRGSFAIYLKSFDDVSCLLSAMGAHRMAQVVEVARVRKSVKNDVNRRVNAEVANQARSSSAAADQLDLIARAEREIGLSKLPPAVREFCRVRKANPELSLGALGQKLDPPASKSAMYHRLLRLQQLVGEVEETGNVPTQKKK
ncbi:MAG: DNA-binding protein WhiA [Tractidigestivibacter sp.]|jgi:DNA-binding protein WhiA|uniref:DNA-binding protein WhiA n=1 Tax=Tractidigestivibacter sp. TaxID=2847320 RepID=UPI003D908571